MQSRVVIPIKVTDMQVVLVERPHPRFQDTWLVYSFDNPSASTDSNFFSTPLIQATREFRPIRMIVCSNGGGSHGTSENGGVCVFWGIGAEDETNVANITWRAMTPTNTGKNELGIRSFGTGNTNIVFTATTAIAHMIATYLHDFLIPPVEVPDGSSLFFMLFHPLALAWSFSFHLTVVVRQEVSV